MSASAIFGRAFVLMFSSAVTSVESRSIAAPSSALALGEHVGLEGLHVADAHPAQTRAQS